jgi:DNA polymerase (family 10)
MSSKIGREQAAEVFQRIALLMELKGENPFKVRAYKSGAEVVESHPDDIMGLAVEGRLKGIKGLGDALQEKLHELAVTGRLEFFEKLKADFPPGLLELFEVQGLGPKKIKVLFEALQVGSVADLKRVCESGEAETLPGFGRKSVEKILESLAFREAHASEFRLDQAAPVAEMLRSFLLEHPAVSRVEVCGSYRRGKEVVHDLDFLAASKQPDEVIAAFTAHPMVVNVIASGGTKASVHVENGLQCDLRVVSTAEFPFAQHYFTGSKEHNVAMRQRALERGWSLNEYGFKAAVDGRPAAPLPEGIEDEAGIYRALGLDYVEPELRENHGELEAAESGGLPELVRLENLRGIFHNHTTASDGRATLREMAEACMELGLQYLGIADHSRSSFQANGLDAVRLLAQVREIRELNEEFAADGRGFRIFAGSEVDILRDGSLDFDDEILAQLDYVVASVHNALQLPEEEMTARLLKAVANPHVTMLGHVTGRLLTQRPASQVNLPAVIDAAAENGTIIELNASAWRLDMDWRWWKMAAAKGVRTSINPDAHSCEGIKDIVFGVKSARKGWLKRPDVVNCLPLGQVETVLQEKRRRAGL